MTDLRLPTRVNCKMTELLGKMTNLIMKMTDLFMTLKLIDDYFVIFLSFPGRLTFDSKSSRQFLWSQKHRLA